MFYTRCNFFNNLSFFFTFGFRTYLPSKISYVVGLWRQELAKTNEKAGQSLADPKDYPNLFPGLEDALKTEQFLAEERKRRIPAKYATQVPVCLRVILIHTKIFNKSMKNIVDYKVLYSV